MISRTRNLHVAGTMDRNSFIRAIAFFTLVVGGLVGVGAFVSYQWTMSWLLLGGTFIAAIASIFIFQGSDQPIVSGLGVSVLSLALGLMIGPVIATYTSIVVLEAVFTALAIMVIMSVLGIMFPQAFVGIGSYLMAGLTMLIFAGFAQIFLAAVLGFEQALDMPILNWVGVAIFTGFVAYDWAKALELPYTLDNAIDASGGLVLDFVNLLLRLLEIYARAQGGSNNSKK